MVCGGCGADHEDSSGCEASVRDADGRDVSYRGKPSSGVPSDGAWMQVVCCRMVNLCGHEAAEYLLPDGKTQILLAGDKLTLTIGYPTFTEV